jgi:hypothetical protein
MIKAATALHQAFAAADRSDAAAEMHPDVMLIDMAMRTHAIGKVEATRYLERVLTHLPYTLASTLRHVGGGHSGGGLEWTAGPGAGHLAGITALELDPDGLITRSPRCTTQGNSTPQASTNSSSQRPVKHQIP